MTVERFEFLGVVAYGFAEGHSAGTLLPSQSLFIGSNNYVIDAIAVAISGSMEFSLDGFVQLTDRENAAIRLHVCDGDYDFNTADQTTNPIIWSTTLDWSPPVMTRTVYLSLPANNVATGEPAISGTAQVGQELTADASPIVDTDGLTDVDFTYQWLRVDADGASNEEEITGEILATYTLTNADVGKKVKVKVSFTDELNGEEERTSAAYPSSGTVTAAPAQAQTEVWTATLTPGDLNLSILGCSNGVDTARCSSTTVLSDDSFNYDSTDYTITKLFVRSGGYFELDFDADITTATAALTLVVGSTSLILADADTITTRERIWHNSGVSLTEGADITVKLTAASTSTTPPRRRPTIR